MSSCSTRVRAWSISLSLSLSQARPPNLTFSTARSRFFFLSSFFPFPCLQVFDARDRFNRLGWWKKRRNPINYAKRDSYDRYTRYIHPRRINLLQLFPIMAGPSPLSPSIEFFCIISSIWESTFANSARAGIWRNLINWSFTIIICHRKFLLNGTRGFERFERFEG